MILTYKKQQNKFWLTQTIENRLKHDFFSQPAIKKELENQLRALDANETTPFEAAETLLAMSSNRTN